MAQLVEETRKSRPIPLVRVGCAVCGLCAVAALLAWAYRLGPFWAWFWGLTVPALGVLAVAGAVGDRSRQLHKWIAVGVLGGVLGTVAYDLFRIPFALFGYRLLTPIDSYGLLLLNAHHSSPATGFAGWLYHLADGVGFAVAYALIASGRRWWWGLVWGSTLETISLLTPLAGLYGISGKPDVIAIAYGGHLAYGAVLGLVVQHHEASYAYLRSFGRHATTWMLVGSVLALGLWLRPWSASHDDVTVSNGHLFPQWLRVAPGGCVTIKNLDDSAYVVAKATPPTRLEPGRTATVCFAGQGVKRLKLGTRPWSGGFVLVDPEMAR